MRMLSTALLLVLAVGCQAGTEPSAATYRVVSDISTGKQAGTYDVVTRVYRKAESGELKLCEPRSTVKEGGRSLVLMALPDGEAVEVLTTPAQVHGAEKCVVKVAIVAGRGLKPVQTEQTVAVANPRG